MKKILLFYKYIELDHIETIKTWQQELCVSLGLQGRIILATEGINGTLAGSPEATKLYIAAMNEHPLLNDIDFKESLVPAEHTYFDKLKIMIKPELVSSGWKGTNLTVADGGEHLTPEQAHTLLQHHPADLIIFDTRNDYESRIGHFENAITPPIKHFRELAAYFDTHIDLFKDKQVFMNCTGGVRCELASAYLKKKGVAKKVYQLQGGIHRYAEQYPDGFFRGKNYVFDGRVAVKVTNDVLSSCDWCGIACDDYTNCLNASCNKHFITCTACSTACFNTCSKTCKDLVTSQNVKQRNLFKPIKVT